MDDSKKRDYYEVLGVNRDADADQLRSAYRKLAREYHPDVSKAPDAEEQFKEISEAYQVLNDADKRAAYDRYGHAGVDQGGMGAGGFGFPGFEDIFEDFFGFGTRGAARQGPRRGNDLRYDLEIGFEEAVFGCSPELELTRSETCPHCQGSGAEPGTEPIRCPECNGSGQVRRAQQSIFGAFVNVTTCPRCQGRGEIVTSPCSECHGSQRVNRTRKVSVDIPAGVDDGMRVRLAGEGEAGMYGGPAGNLYVMLHVKPHRYFKRQNDDLLINLDINVAQAALGDMIMVPTLGTDKELKIPPGTQTGRVFRLKGEGVARLRGSGRGDELVIVNVKVPDKLSDQQRELFVALGDTLGSEVTPQEERGLFERLKDALGI